MRLKLTYQIITTISIVSQEKNNSDIKTDQTTILEKSYFLSYKKPLPLPIFFNLKIFNIFTFKKSYEKSIFVIYN